MANNNHPVDIPKTYTVAYYNPEIDENITLNQEQLKVIANPSEFKVINKDESYRSWKTDVDSPAYGPMVSVKYQLEPWYHFKNANGEEYSMFKIEGEDIDVLHNLRYKFNKLVDGDLIVVNSKGDRCPDKEEEVKRCLSWDIEALETPKVVDGVARITMAPSGMNANNYYCPQQELQSVDYSSQPTSSEINCIIS